MELLVASFSIELASSEKKNLFDDLQREHEKNKEKERTIREQIENNTKLCQPKCKSKLSMELKIVYGQPAFISFITLLLFRKRYQKN